MTHEESKKYILANWFDGDEDVKAVVNGNEEVMAMKIAVEALEKQIPKNPDLDGGVYCPCCLHEFKANYDTTSYCPNCGQAIDWSDTE